MTPAIDITAEQRRTVLALLNRHLPDTTVWAYGSRVKWTSRPESDLDLVAFARPEQSAQVTELREAFEESNLPFRVDLFVWDEVPGSFRSRIEGDHVVLIKDNPARTDNKKNRWRRCRIDDIAEKVAMGPFGSSIKVETFTPSGVPIISGQHLHGSRVDDKPGFNFISEEHAERLRGANVRKGDIVLTHRGNIGQISYIPYNSQYEKYVASQSQFYMRPKLSEAIPEFIVAYFKTPEGQHELLANASQVGVPSIARPVTYLRSIEIPIPPIREQHAIAHILGTLDDKIELNRRMNETLEAMARALFKSWFVDFDPVRAKMEGRDTGLPKSISDIFPDRLVDSVLGKIPEGWAVENLAEHFEIVKGVSYKGSGLGDDGVPLHNLNSIRKGGGYKYEGVKFYSGEYSDRHSVRPGDVIVANTDLGHDRRLIGYSALVPEMFGSHGIASHHVYRLRAKRNGRLSTGYLHLLLNSPQMHGVVSGYANGTTVNMLPIDALQRPPVVMPPKALAKALDSVAGCAEQRRERIVKESRLLASLRDTLLPKLISGEMRLCDAARQVESVA